MQAFWREHYIPDNCDMKVATFLKLWHVRLMKPWSFTSHLLLALALFGLVVGPVPAASTTPAMSAQAMAEMPDGMSCCPDDQPAVPDCAKGCPLAVLCVSGVVSVSLPEVTSFVVRAPVGDGFLDGRDVVLSSLAGEPPPRPPKA